MRLTRVVDSKVTVKVGVSRSCSCSCSRSRMRTCRLTLPLPRDRRVLPFSDRPSVQIQSDAHRRAHTSALPGLNYTPALAVVDNNSSNNRSDNYDNNKIAPPLAVGQSASQPAAGEPEAGTHLLARPYLRAWAIS